MILNESLFEDVESRDDVVYYEYDKDNDKYFIYNKKSKVYPLPSNSETSEEDAKKAVEVIKKYYVDLDEYLQYDNRRDEDENEFVDDEFLFDEEKSVVDEQLKKETDPEKKEEIQKNIDELADEAEKCDDSNNPYGAASCYKQIKSLEEDVEQPISPEDVTEKDLASEDEIVEQNAYTNLLIDALNEEWATVQHYQEIINQLQEHDEYKDLIVVIEDIIKDEKNHVGNLQMIIDTISTKTLTDIADGEQEAIDQLEGKED